MFALRILRVVMGDKPNELNKVLTGEHHLSAGF